MPPKRVTPRRLSSGTNHRGRNPLPTSTASAASLQSSVALEIDLGRGRRGNWQRYAVREMAMPSPHSAVPWLQGQLLPTAVMESSQDEPAMRGRVIDGALVLVAAVLGAVSLASGWAARDAWILWLLRWARLGCVCGDRASPSAPNCCRRRRARGDDCVAAGGGCRVGRAVQRRRQSVASRAGLDFRPVRRLEAICPLLRSERDIGGYWGTMALCVLVMAVAIGWGLFA